MDDIDRALSLATCQLSNENYAQTLAFYRLWLDIKQTHYHQIPSDLFLEAIWNIRWKSPSMTGGQVIHPTARLILRFASDVESDYLLAPRSPELQSRLRARILQEFFNSNLQAGGRRVDEDKTCLDANLVAHWANLGCVEEAVIRNHILQSLISHPKLYDHQADALIVLFKLAGATFGAYADPSVIDRCLELLKDHKYHNEHLAYFNSNHPGYDGSKPYSVDGIWMGVLNRGNSYDLTKKELVQVGAPLPVEAVIRLRRISRR